MRNAELGSLPFLNSEFRIPNCLVVFATNSESYAKTTKKFRIPKGGFSIINHQSFNHQSTWYHDEHSTLKRKDRAEIFKQLDFDITHQCNKNCPNCNLRIATSNFSNLKFYQYHYVVGQISDRTQIKRIKISGGEPLVHPHFHTIVNAMLNDFNNPHIRILTNGKLLNTVQPALFNRLDWRISHYPGFNDEIIQKYKQYENVYIHPYSGEFKNPVVNLDISDKKAKQIRENCMFSIRIIGTDLYQCCLSYQAEQNNNIGKVSTHFDKNWKENWENLETWRACRHCLTAKERL